VRERERACLTCVTCDLICVKRDLLCVKRDLLCVKRDLVCVKRDLVCVKRDLTCVKRVCMLNLCHVRMHAYACIHAPLRLLLLMCSHCISIYLCMHTRSPTPPLTNVFSPTPPLTNVFSLHQHLPMHAYTLTLFEKPTDVFSPTPPLTNVFSLHTRSHFSRNLQRLRL